MKTRKPKAVGRDDLDDFIAERTKKNPAFRGLLAEAEERRRLGRRLAAARDSKGLSQTKVALKMGTAQSVVSKLEGGADVKVSTLIKYLKTLGVAVQIGR